MTCTHHATQGTRRNYHSQAPAITQATFTQAKHLFFLFGKLTGPQRFPSSQRLPPFYTHTHNPPLPTHIHNRKGKAPPLTQKMAHRQLLLLLLVLVTLLDLATAFIPRTPRSSSSSSSTRLHLWGGTKKAAETPAAPPVAAKGGRKGAPPPPLAAKKRATPMKYGQNTVVERDEDVIVPATEYFANKNDPIVPLIFAGLFIPVFGLLGWWLYGPQPEIVSISFLDCSLSFCVCVRFVEGAASVFGVEASARGDQ